jgi:hypothetical protein
LNTNAELETLIKRENIVRVINSHRFQWTAHVILIVPLRTVKKLTDSKPRSSRPVGKPRLRCNGEMEEDLKKAKVRN